MPLTWQYAGVGHHANAASFVHFDVRDMQGHHANAASFVRFYVRDFVLSSYYLYRASTAYSVRFRIRDILDHHVGAASSSCFFAHVGTLDNLDCVVHVRLHTPC
jgi:hypothetical protein